MRYKKAYFAKAAIIAPEPNEIFLSQLKTKIKIALEIIMNGTIGASDAGNSPDDNATTDGTNPTKIAGPIPKVAAPKNSVALIIGPVMN